MSDNPKLKVIHGHAYANSREIAEHFGKEHYHVMRQIRSLLDTLCPPEFSNPAADPASNFGGSNDFAQRNFAEAAYTGHDGKEHPCYQMTRDGFTLVAMSFTGAEALFWKIAYITAFNEMETELQRRNLRDGRFEQMNLFPGLRETIDAARPAMTVTAALTILGYEGLMIPLVTRDHLISMLKRGRLAGFNDGRNWQIYQDSFDSFIKERRGSTAKAA